MSKFKSSKQRKAVMAKLKTSAGRNIYTIFQMSALESEKRRKKMYSNKVRKIEQALLSKSWRNQKRMQELFMSAGILASNEEERLKVARLGDKYYIKKELGV